MLLRKAYSYRLMPTPEQAAVLGQWVGAVRCVYNLALEQRRSWRPGRQFSYAQQCREVTQLRAEYDWLKAVPVHPLQQALRDLLQAYKNWWAGFAEAPTPRRRGRNDSLRFPDPATFEVKRVGKRLGMVKLPKLGWVKFRWSRGFPGSQKSGGAAVLKSLTLRREAGQWQLSVAYAQEVAEPHASTLPEVGIDRGVAVFAATSDEQLVQPGNFGKKAMKRLAKAQRVVERRRKGSRRRRKALARVARLHLRVRNARKDYLHKHSTNMAKSHGVVVLEQLMVPNMVRSAAGTVEKPGRNVRQKSGLNRAILDQGWGMFRTMLGYKLSERGGILAEVPAHNTSRTCAACGYVDAASRRAQRFRCTGCGHTDHADINAAKVILAQWRMMMNGGGIRPRDVVQESCATSTLMEGSGCAPCEVRTTCGVAA